MVLSPLVARQFENQMRVLTRTKQMIVELVADFQRQLTYLDPNEGDLYATVYRTVRDGQLCMQMMNDLIWDVWSLYGEFDRFPRRVRHRNGSSQ